MEVYCYCCSVAHQPNHQGNAINLQDHKIDSGNIRPEYEYLVQDHCKCRKWYQFRNFSWSATAFCIAMFCCASADYAFGVSPVQSTGLKYVLRLLRVCRKSCKNLAMDLPKKSPRNHKTTSLLLLLRLQALDVL
jgi:hypothetical protein